MLNTSDKGIIFSHTHNLKPKDENSRRRFYIDDDRDAESKDQREFYRDLAKENSNKLKEDQKLVRLNRGKILINNKEFSHSHRIPKKSELLKINGVELEDILAVKLIEGGEHMEEGSKFIGFAQKAKSMVDVNKGLKKLVIKYADATHISCAYRFGNELEQQGYENGGEIGQGRNILSVLRTKDMENICVYVVRYYGRKHLGKRRFEIAKRLANSSIKEFQLTKQSRNARLSRANLGGSQTSLALMLSDVSYQSLLDREISLQEGAEQEPDIQEKTMKSDEQNEDEQPS